MSEVLHALRQGVVTRYYSDLSLNLRVIGHEAEDLIFLPHITLTNQLLILLPDVVSLSFFSVYYFDILRYLIHFTSHIDLLLFFD